MEEMIQHKNRSLFRIETKKCYDTITKDVWNGRDSDELCGTVKETKKIFTGTNVKIFKAVPDMANLEKKLDVIKQIDAICNANYIPRYNRHVKVDTSYELYHEFDVEDELEDMPLHNEILVHHGIRGSYFINANYGLHFDIYKMLWSDDSEFRYTEEQENLMKELILIAFEDKGVKIDERYIQ